VRPAYDQVLLETANYVVAPTLGSIVPNWLLIVPKSHCQNFFEWRQAAAIDPFRVVRQVLRNLQVGAERALWFEHGACSQGSPVGCGVDHAHIHVVVDAPFAGDHFFWASEDRSDLSWSRLDSSRLYDHIIGDASYLLAGCGVNGIVAQNVEGVGSQFFRRIIAELTNQPEAWNYKTHPHLDNIRRTLTRFGQSHRQHAAQ
jgi:diadenosine tetraphosphate (Ap4A) HIT family hydrolase